MKTDRRRLLKGLGGILVPLAAPGWRQSFHEDEDVVPWADGASMPEGARGARFTDLSRLRGAIVPVEDFFVLQHGDVPRIREREFRLVVSGDVDRVESWTLERLRGLEKTVRTVCFECAGNGGVGMHGLVGNATWGGVRLRSILEASGVHASAREIVFYGADTVAERVRGNAYDARFARSLPVRDAVSSELDVLLAYEMNGEPLTPAHGFPLRLIVPGWYGIAQVKWLTAIEAVPERFMGFYMAKDYVTVRGEDVGGRVFHRATSVGRQRLKSIATRVTRAGDAYVVHGFAWSGGTRIARVDVEIDGALAGSAHLESAPSVYAWTPFRFRWEGAERGEHSVTSIAYDANGRQRTDEEASRYKATPWENDGQVVRRIVIPG